MKKMLFAIAMGLLLVSGGNSIAQTSAVQTKVDMAKITCADLAQSYLDEFVVVAAWMSGYYNAKNNNTLVDPDQLSSNAKKVSMLCKENPAMTVMHAIEKLSTLPK